MANDADEREASDLIRQGRYFEQARQWYTAMYIGPISERSFFLVLAVLALIIGLMGFIGLVGLTPVTSRPPVIIKNDRIDDTIPRLVRMRGDGMSIDEAFRRYYVTQYVLSRETYVAEQFATDMAFVQAHSDPTVAAEYLAATGPDNPNNPAALLGVHGTRMVDIEGISFGQSAAGNPTATVQFSTEIGGSVTASRTRWTATIEFLYSDAVVTETTDPESGDNVATLQQPAFQVVSYVRTQLP